MYRYKFLSIGFLFFLSQLSSRAQDFSAYMKLEFSKGKKILFYRFLQPQDYDSTKKYPLIIFLHGAGLKGNDNEKQLKVGGAYFLRDSNRIQYPAYVLFPQCPVDDFWNYLDIKYELKEDSGLLKPAVKEILFPFNDTPTVTTGLLLALIDSLRNSKNIRSTNIYIGGASQGAMGVWDIVARKPDWFAAAFPICGWGNTDVITYFSKKTKFWIFHGKDDDVIPAKYSREFYKKMLRKGYNVKYSEYPGVKHDSWNNTFLEKDLLHWMFMD